MTLSSFLGGCECLLSSFYTEIALESIQYAMRIAQIQIAPPQATPSPPKLTKRRADTETPAANHTRKMSYPRIKLPECDLIFYLQTETPRSA